MESLNDPLVITQDDIDGLNQRAIVRIANTTRLTAKVLAGISTFVTIGWLWQTARYQGLLQDDPDQGFGFGFPAGADVGWDDRLDLFVNSLGILAFAALVAGLAAGLWLLAEAVTLRAGSSLTGWELGDAVTPDDVDADDDDDDDPAVPPTPDDDPSRWAPGADGA